MRKLLIFKLIPKIFFDEVDIIYKKGPVWSIVLGCWVDHACSNRHCPSIMTTIRALTDHTIMSLLRTHTIINIHQGACIEGFLSKLCIDPVSL